MDIAPRPVDPMGVPARTSVELRDHDHRTTIALCPPNHHSTEEGLRRRTRVASISPPGTPERFEVGFGGFPGPEELITRMSRKLLPGLHRNLRQTFTMPRTATLVPQDGGSHEVDATGQITRVPYLSFIADVKRNSRFHDLTEEQLLELGGVEYRALNTLLWVVPLVSLFTCVLHTDIQVNTVLFWTSGHLYVNSDAVHLSDKLGRYFLTPTTASQNFTYMVLLFTLLYVHSTQTLAFQVLHLPGRRSLGQYWNVCCRPKYGTLPSGIPHDSSLDYMRTCGEYGFCE